MEAEIFDVGSFAGFHPGLVDHVTSEWPAILAREHQLSIYLDIMYQSGRVSEEALADVFPRRLK
jgi:hypothetical protein